MGVPLTSGTIERIEMLFPAEHRELVSALLIEDCGDGLPFMDSADPVALERIRFAVLKLSAGDLNALQRALDLAKLDWRDALVAASFGDDPRAHRTWWPDGSHPST